jgi:hypothetical protein
MGTSVRLPLILIWGALLARDGTANPIVFATLDASLNTGSLAGTMFPVVFSYDEGQVTTSGLSFVMLSSFNFTLLGTAFNSGEIDEGGQAVFNNGVLENVTASYQGTLPAGAPVENITFGFGGPGVIGYTDLSGNPGLGSFTIPEPGTLSLCLAACCCLALLSRSKRRAADLKP